MRLRQRFACSLAGMGLALFGVQLRAAEPLIAEAIVNAPVATVWKAFVTPEGYASVGVPHASIDLQAGGLIAVQTARQGTLEDAGATRSEILAFEPERLLSTRVRQPPAGFAAAPAFARTWSILYFTPLGTEMTHVRIAGFGFTEGPDAAGLTRFFEQDNALHLKRLEKHYWPLCALCKKEGD